jgi:lipid-binding SYLF domain-containing protein
MTERPQTNPTTRRNLTARILPATALALAATTTTLLRPKPAQAATAAEINADVAAALTRLRNLDNTRPLFAQARAVLVFPRIIQGGFIVGGQYGEGALLRGGNTQGYFNIAGVSLGLLAGAQASGLAMFFMTDEALNALMRADGWEIGTGPSVVALDRGLQANITATTLREPVYAITFNQEGLMAALALNGTKITRINPS